MTRQNLPLNPLHPNRRPLAAAANADALESRIALRIAAVLHDGARAVPADVSERLRFARERALERARATSRLTAVAAGVVGNGGAALSAGLPPGRGDWWLRLASVLPLAALVGGLLLIQQLHADSQISATAEVDAELLADEVPPNAYSDPGFVEFLKSPAD